MAQKDIEGGILVENFSKMGAIKITPASSRPKMPKN